MEERPLIQHKVIDGLLLRDMLVAGANLLEQNREAVDALNVFPVPDGDTGTNMSLTMQSAVREINAQEYLAIELETTCDTVLKEEYKCSDKAFMSWVPIGAVMLILSAAFFTFGLPVVSLATVITPFFSLLFSKR